MGNAINKLVFQPPKPASYAEDDIDIMWIKTRHGSDIPAAMVRHHDPQATILYSHGNAEDLGMAVAWAKEASRRLHVNVFCYDYTGYGLSEGGKCSETHTYNDIEAVYDYLTTVMNESAQGLPYLSRPIQSHRHANALIDISFISLSLLPCDSEIVLYGRSLGSGPTVHLAHKIPQCATGVILHSPLASAYRVAWHTSFTAPGDVYCNIDKVHHIPVPVFVLHGTEDEVVPFKAGQAIHAKCQAPWDPWWVNGGGHNNLEYQWKATYYDQLRKFLSGHSHDASQAFPSD